MRMELLYSLMGSVKSLDKYQFMKDELNRMKYKLLTSEDEYLHHDGHKVMITCAKHEPFLSSYTNIKKNRKCKQCVYESQRLSRHKVTEKLKSRGLTVVDFRNYIDGNSKIVVKCSNNHYYETTYSKSYIGNCLLCSHIKKRKSRQELEHLFVSKDFTIINGLDEYKDKDSRFTIECNKGHRYETSYCSFVGSKGNCSICVKVRPHNLEYVKERFKERNLIPLFESYKNCKTPLAFVCPLHNDIAQDITLLSLLNGIGCKKCGRERISGSNHYCWNGGISKINEHLRGKISGWKEDSLNKYGRQCVLTGEKDNLDIHHLTTTFSDITKEVLKELDISESTLSLSVSDIDDVLLEKIRKLCVEKHYKYGLGIPLRRDLHIDFHVQYGYGNNTYEQFLEFTQDYKKINIIEERQYVI